MRTLLWAFLLSLAIVGSATAQGIQVSQPTQGYTYFNRANATVAEHESDLRVCQSHALQLSPVGASLHRGSIAYALINSGPENAVFVSGVENCMIVKGWRVVRLPEAEGLALSALDHQALLERLSPWIGAAQPNGEIIRAWGNEAADGRSDRFETRPRATRDGALSLATLGDGEVVLSDVSNRPRRNFGGLNPNEIAAAAERGGVVVLRLQGIGARSGNEISFTRVAPESAGLPSDGGVNMATAIFPVFAARAEGNWRAFALPAGRWRIAAMGPLSFCLGSPAFDVGQGAIVYAGSFDFSAPSLGPDLSLEPFQSWLGDPTLAQRATAATYSNGWQGVCTGSAIYALEIEGAPFREGYSGGGALSPR